MDCLPLQPGCRQGQGCELSEDPRFWALDGAWGPLFIKTSCPCLHIFITSKCQDLAPPSSELTSHCPPVGDPPLPRLVTEGVGQGWGFSLYIPCHTNPQVFSLVCFYFNFFVLIFFFNKNFHFKHIYTEGICAVYRGELDPELERVGPREGRGSEGLPLPLRAPAPPGPPPQPFLLSFLFKTVKY